MTNPAPGLPTVHRNADQLIVRISWTPPLRFPSPGLTDPLLEDFFMGKKKPPAPGIFCWDGLPPFQRRVLQLLLEIPRGFVTTYGALAAAAGSPGGAQAAGNAVAANPFPFLVPCHRVLPSSLLTGTYAGIPHSPDKIRLLQLEQVPLLPAGKGLTRAAPEAVWQFPERTP